MLAETLIRSRKKKAERTDDELMALVRRGDNEAFRILYNRYKGQLFLYCFRMLNDRESARDALQEIFVRLHDNAEKYQSGTNFPGWIHTIARNLCLNVQRSRKEQVDFDETHLYHIDPVANDEDIYLREKLAEEIAALPEIYREAVILREYEGYSYKQIAEITGQTLATIKFRIFKGREMLRQSLGPWLDDLRGEKE
jgi:RNA polymerase sigma-70 factor (ECF subfamily)